MDAQQILEASDGVALILDGDLAIASVGWPNWRRFWKANGGVGEPALVGEPITRFFTGDEVRDLFRDLFNDVLESRSPSIHIDYRCDAPTMRRAMRLSVTPIQEPSKRSLLYQSILLCEDLRPALPLFSAPSAGAHQEAALPICVICQKVKWPSAATDKAEWVEPQQYYRQGGPDVVLLSHGFCTECRASLRALRH